MHQFLFSDHRTIRNHQWPTDPESKDISVELSIFPQNRASNIKTLVPRRKTLTDATIAHEFYIQIRRISNRHILDFRENLAAPLPPAPITLSSLYLFLLLLIIYMTSLDDSVELMVLLQHCIGLQTSIYTHFKQIFFVFSFRMEENFIQ